MGESFGEQTETSVGEREAACSTMLPVAYEVNGMVTAGVMSPSQLDEIDPLTMRTKVLNAIVRSLATKRPSWDHQRIVHLSRQLEESICSAGESKAAYQDVSRGTLEERINRHCLRLATQKTSTSSTNTYSCNGVSEKRAQDHHAQVPLVLETNVIVQHGEKRVVGYGRGGLGQSVKQAPARGVRVVSRSENVCGIATTPAGPVRDLEHRSSEVEAAAVAPLRNNHGLNGSLYANRPSLLAGEANDRSPEICAPRGYEELAVEQPVMVDCCDEKQEWGLSVDRESAVVAGAVAVAVGAKVQDGSKEREYVPSYDEGVNDMKRHALRLLQCRVLLLAHASSCTHEKRKCQLSPLCDSVRQLLRHMQACRIRDACDFPHCNSSKAVLRHQHLCRDSACGLCRSVRDLSQKCFWANARLTHKRRLQESYELRRKKRIREGKPVASLHKQSGKAKSSGETCSGLDEKGNYLGDITPGFFLRQDQALKARKISREGAASQATDANAHATSTTIAHATESNVPHESSMPERTKADETNKSAKAFAATSSISGGSVIISSSSDSEDRAVTHHQRQYQLRQHERLHQQGQELRGATVAANVSASGTAPYQTGTARVYPRTAGVSIGVGHEDQQWLLESAAPAEGQEWSREGNVFTPSSTSLAVASPVWARRSVSKDFLQERGVSVTGSEADDRGFEVWSEAPKVLAGHLKSSSEKMLDDLVESLADTARKPSFARMQSVQAFLHEHTELKASASFGDISALVEQWMARDYQPGDDDHFGLSCALSF